jgi:prepilin signal peptidase PulO-like enzyme (type II secretory pathway)
VTVPPSTAHQPVDIVALMTERWDRRAVRLAWAIELFSLVLVIASLVLLALDWQTLDSPFITQLPVFLGALIVGILGVLIAARRPRNPIGIKGECIPLSTH